MNSTLITNAQIVYPSKKIALGQLLLTAGRIAAIDPAPAAIPAGTTRIDAGGRCLTPGLIDLHTHRAVCAK